MTPEDREYLDSLSDTAFIYWIHAHYATTIPQWEDCSKEEYEKYCGKVGDAITTTLLEHLVDNIINGREYKKVPFWNNGGGILDQISDKKPDGYYYQKCAGYKTVLMLGKEMIDYCRTRECMKPYFEEE